jgi:ABC-type lipoprotein release transport system permease subunit
MAIPFVYNVRNVVQRPVATAATAIGIGLTVAVLLAALALAEGFRSTLRSAGSPDKVLVLSSGADSEVMSGFPRSAGDILRANPHVASGPGGRAEATLEMVATTNLPRIGQKGSSNIRVRGIDVATVAVRAEPVMVAGRMFTPGTDEIVVGRGIATRFEHCAVGDQIRIQRQMLTVVGLFATGGSSYESEIWGDANVLQPLFHRQGGYQVALMRMKDPSTFAAFKKELESDPRLGVDVQREDLYYAEQSQGVAILVTVLGGFITVIMAVGALFGAANTMFAAVSGRTREIATLLVLGFSPFAVMLSFVVESVFIALIGGVLGCVIALPINGITTSTTNFQSFSEVAFQFKVTPALMLAALVFAAILGVMGGFFPALRAANQPIARTLRGG